MQQNNFYSLLKKPYRRLRMMIFYSRYFFQFLRYSNTETIDNTEDKINFKALFLIHKLEKGMAFKNTKCPFGVDIVTEIILLLEKQELSSEVAKKTSNILFLYSKVLDEKCKKRLQILDEYLDKIEINEAELIYNQAYKELEPQTFIDIHKYKSFFNSRVSIRDYSNEFTEKDFESIIEAIEIAKKTPSVCNRQPWKVVIVKDKNKIDELLMFQNGNKGFTNIKVLLVVVSNLSGYIGPKEIYQPFFDSGMLSMSILLSIHASGLVACPLNLCTSNTTQDLIIDSLNLEKNYRATLMISVGKPEQNKVKACISPLQNSLIQKII